MSYVKPHAAGCIIVKGAILWVVIVGIVPAAIAWLFLYYDYIIVIPSAIIRRGGYDCCAGVIVIVDCIVVAVIVARYIIVALLVVGFATQ